MEEGFERGQSDNLPSVSGEAIALFFERNRNFVSSEIRGVKAERSARNTYGDNAVGYVQVKRENSHCILKARVTPEHKVKKKAYCVTMIFNESTEEVLSVQCESCAASVGGCKHAVAFLFWVHRRSCEPATTEVTNYWKKSKLSSVGTSQQFVYSTELGKKKMLSLPPQDYTITNEMVEMLKVKKIENSQLCNYFSFNLLKQKVSLHALKLNFLADGLGSTAEQFCNFLISNLTEDVCKEAEKASRGQVDCLMWHELRYGRITASRIHEAAHCLTLNGSLVETILGAKLKVTEAMKRGTKLEGDVLKEIEKKHKTKITNCGLILNPQMPILGASPDGLTCDFVVEVKCPMSVKAIERYIRNDRPTAKYFAQVQLQMMFSKKPKALFCIALPDFEKSCSFLEYWVDYDSEYCRCLVEKAELFWQKAVYPLL